MQDGACFDLVMRRRLRRRREEYAGVRTRVLPAGAAPVRVGRGIANGCAEIRTERSGRPIASAQVAKDADERLLDEVLSVRQLRPTGNRDTGWDAAS